MAFGFKKLLTGLNIVPVTSSSADSKGDLEVIGSTGKIQYHNGTSLSPLVTESGTATLTNKTLSGNIASNLINGSGTFNFNSSGTITAPNATDTLVARDTTDTLTNKTMSGSNNTFSNIGYSSLTLTGSIVNADINASAAIAYSKLNLSGSIVNADVNASAAIAYSKLNLSGSIVNADVNASAAIDRSKLASGSANHVIINDGSGNFSSEAQLASTRGGTGISNAGTLTYGSNNITFTTSGTTSLTLPTSGTVVSKDTNSNVFLNNSILNFTSTSGDVTLTVASSQYQSVDGLLFARNITLPDATTLTNGHTFTIYNSVVGATLTIKKGDGSTLTSDLNAGDTCTVTLTNNGSVAGAWNTSINRSLAVRTTATQTLTNKDYDGGTASNSLRLTVPKNTLSNLNGLTRKEATIVYGTDTQTLYVDTGSTLNPIGGNWSVNSSTSLTGGGTIAISTTLGQQLWRVAGTSAVTLSNTPFGTSAPANGTVLIIQGTDSTNTVTITNVDSAKGAVINGPATLRKYDAITLQYNSTDDRYVEISRNF